MRNRFLQKSKMLLMNLTGNKINVIVWHMEMNGNVENYLKELWGIMIRCKILRAVGTDGEKKNNIYAGCNIDIWMRENISEQIIQIRSRRVYRNPYRFSGCGNQNDKKKIEKLFAKNVSGEKFEKQPDKFLEFYSETIKDGTLDKDSILMRVTGSQDRNFYRIMDSGAKITKGNQTIIFIWRLSRRIRNIRKIKEFRLLIWPQRRRIMTDIFSGIRKKESLHRRKSVKIIGRCLYSDND